MYVFIIDGGNESTGTGIYLKNAGYWWSLRDITDFGTSSFNIQLLNTGTVSGVILIVKACWAIFEKKKYEKLFNTVK